jgi:predicted aspartyl protease
VNISLPARNSPRSKRFDGIIDSGASSCLFHGSIGRAIGLNVENGKKANTLGVAGAMEIFLHEVTIYIPGGPVTTVAGFSDQASVACLLGMSGFFEHFRIVFDPTALCVELERIYRT